MLFFVKSAEKQKRVKFRLDFLIKQRKVGIWFIIYLRQNVYKSILLFPKTILFLAMLLVCGRCHFRMNALDHNSNVATLENQKSYNNIQSSRTLVSWICKKPWGTHTQKKLEIKLERSLVPFSFKFTISNDANAPVLVEVRVCSIWTALLLTKWNRSPATT